jgi:hypothetical protein
MKKSACIQAPNGENLMAQITSIQSVPEEACAPASVADNPAVARCSDAYESALKEAGEHGKDSVFAELDAEKAFRKALPPLSGLQNIRDFIACVAYGMLLGAISGTDGARLLYAAQVAHATIGKPAVSSKSAAA